MRYVSRTIGPLHFEDLEAHRFEDLVRQLAHGFRPWRYLEATGRLGGDEGVDIRGVEMVAAPTAPGEEFPDEDDQDDAPGDLPLVVGERVWRIQCKRYKTLRPQQMRTIVDELIPDRTEVPYGVILAAACDASATAMAAFRQEAFARGVRESHLWVKAHLEDLLFLPQHDHLLFAYFGISLTARRRSGVQRVREYIAIKRKLLRALKRDSLVGRSMGTVLIRNLADEAYPYTGEVSGFDALRCPPWHVGEVERFEPYHLLVWRWGFEGWVKPNGTWDILEDSRATVDPRIREAELDDPEAFARMRERSERHWQLRQRISHREQANIGEVWVLPMRRILEVDPIGDGYYDMPHLHCHFEGDDGPYADGIRLFLPRDSRFANDDGGVLKDEKREPLFASLEGSSSEGA